MNYYQSEICRIKKACYSNTAQLLTAVGTRRFIDQNFVQDLSLDTLSLVGYTSKFHLLRLFKKYYGQTPKQYLLDKRLGKSRQYLKSGMPVSETCYAVGFGNPSSFSTLFKSRLGVAPQEFQKRAIFAK